MQPRSRFTKSRAFLVNWPFPTKKTKETDEEAVVDQEPRRKLRTMQVLGCIVIYFIYSDPFTYISYLIILLINFCRP